MEGYVIRVIQQDGNENCYLHSVKPFDPKSDFVVKEGIIGAIIFKGIVAAEKFICSFNEQTRIQLLAIDILTIKPQK